MLVSMLEGLGDYHDQWLVAPQCLTWCAPICSRQLIEKFNLLLPNVAECRGQIFKPTFLDFGPRFVIILPGVIRRD